MANIKKWFNLAVTAIDLGYFQETSLEQNKFTHIYPIICFFLFRLLFIQKLLQSTFKKSSSIITKQNKEQNSHHYRNNCLLLTQYADIFNDYLKPIFNYIY